MPLPSSLVLEESLSISDKHQSTQEWVLSQENKNYNPPPSELLPLIMPLAPPSSPNESIAVPEGPLPISGRSLGSSESSFIGKDIKVAQQKFRPSEVDTHNVLGRVLRGASDFFGKIFTKLGCIVDQDNDQYGEEGVAMDPMVYLTESELGQLHS